MTERPETLWHLLAIDGRLWRLAAGLHGRLEQGTYAVLLTTDGLCSHLIASHLGLKTGGREISRLAAAAPSF